jgi:hypothetical protein
MRAAGRLGAASKEEESLSNEDYEEKSGRGRETSRHVGRSVQPICRAPWLEMIRVPGNPWSFLQRSANRLMDRAFAQTEIFYQGPKMAA